MVERIFDILLKGDEVTWQQLLMDLVKQEGMDPWDIDVSLMARRYIEMIKKMKELDFRISGKVVLAAALLLKLKSRYLLTDEVEELDRLMRPQEEEEFYEGLEAEYGEHYEKPPEGQPLIPRTPQPRKRKVSIYDLIHALDKALEVKERRVLRQMPLAELKRPERKVDITKLLDSVFDRIKGFFSRGKQEIAFEELLKDDTKEEKFYTLLSALHLANFDHRKIDLHQKEHFGRITITRGDESKAVKRKEGEEEQAEAA